MVSKDHSNNIPKKDYGYYRNWSDGFYKIDEINRVMYKVLKTSACDIIDLQSASEEDDYKRSIDYEITIKSGKIACRIRNIEEMFDQSWRDFTIRSKNNGHITEIDKLQTAEVRWYLYCWAYGKRIVDYIFIDLDILREKNLLFMDWKEKWNKDGTAFIIIPFQKLLECHCIMQYDSNIISDYVKKSGYRKPRRNKRDYKIGGSN